MTPNLTIRPSCARVLGPWLVTAAGVAGVIAAAWLITR